MTAAVLFATALAAPVWADSVTAREGLVRWSADVPEDAAARVHAVYTASGGTVVTLHVTGLKPRTDYGAHAHVGACGAAPSSARGHFQHVVGGATDPAFANPTNEVWLDLTTNAAGNGVAQARVPWHFDPDRRAASVVLHAEHTRTGPTDSGVAGPRLACVPVSF